MDGQYGCASIVSPWFDGKAVVAIRAWILSPLTNFHEVHSLLEFNMLSAENSRMQVSLLPTPPLLDLFVGDRVLRAFSND